MVTIRAHHKKTGEVTIMKVKKGTPMGEVCMKIVVAKICRGCRRSSSSTRKRRDSPRGR